MRVHLGVVAVVPLIKCFFIPRMSLLVLFLDIRLSHYLNRRDGIQLSHHWSGDQVARKGAGVRTEGQHSRGVYLTFGMTTGALGVDIDNLFRVVDTENQFEWSIMISFLIHVFEFT